MSRVSDHYESMALDDFEDLLADKPRDAKWDLIGGRVVRMMVGDGRASQRRIEGLDAILTPPALALTIPLVEIDQDVLAA